MIRKHFAEYAGCFFSAKKEGSEWNGYQRKICKSLDNQKHHNIAFDYRICCVVIRRNTD